MWLIEAITDDEAALIAFGIIFGGGMLGLAIGRLLPKHHLGEGTRWIVQVAMGAISVLAVFVLGFLINSAKVKYETARVQIELLASNLIILDGDLRHFGPETVKARDLLRQFITIETAALWTLDRRNPTFDSPSSPQLLDRFQVALFELTPNTEVQRLRLADAISVAAEVVKITWRQVSLAADKFSQPFLLLSVIWLGIAFFCWCLFAPRNAIVVGIVFLCAISISVAVTLIEDLDHPFGGYIRVSRAPIDDALNRMGTQ